MKLLKFYGTYCSPCKALTKTINETKFNEDFSIESYNVEEEFELTEQYRVKSVPTCVLLDNDNKEIKRWVGTFNVKEELKEFIKND